MNGNKRLSLSLSLYLHLPDAEIVKKKSFFFGRIAIRATTYGRSIPRYRSLSKSVSKGVSKGHLCMQIRWGAAQKKTGTKKNKSRSGNVTSNCIVFFLLGAGGNFPVFGFFFLRNDRYRYRITRDRECGATIKMEVETLRGKTKQNQRRRERKPKHKKKTSDERTNQRCSTFDSAADVGRSLAFSFSFIFWFLFQISSFDD